MRVIRGSSRRIRRIVNSGVSIRRSRVCSGGSKASRLPARIAASSSALRWTPDSWKLAIWALLNRSASLSTARTSS